METLSTKKLIYIRILIVFQFLILHNISNAQVFTSGAIPMCDTSYFTENISGMGQLTPVGYNGYGNYLSSVGINITSNHPQTLKITLTSPAGTTLLLSAFNGAGGSNYTSTYFLNGWAPSITTGAAPFSGSWQAQGGSLSVFDWQNPNGIWTITVIDTACQGGTTGSGASWSAGYFDGAAAGGFGFGQNYPLCWGGIPVGQATICQGESFDIIAYYQSNYPYYYYNFGLSLNWNQVSGPATVGGTYQVSAYDWYGCMYWANFYLTVNPKPSLGLDRVITQCQGLSQNLNSLFNLTGLTSSWTFNGSPISSATASAASTTGVYQLIAQNTYGCSDTVIVTLNFSSGFSLGADQNIVECSNGGYNLTNLYNTSGLTTAWSLNGNIITVPSSVNVNGNYTLVATDVAGCKDTAIVSLNLLPTPSLGSDQAKNVCNNSSIDLSTLINTTGYSSSWTSSGNPVTNPASVNSAGLYSLVAMAPNGCSDTANVSVSVLTAPTLGVDQSYSICSNTTLNLIPLYNTSGLIRHWTYNGSPVANPTNVNSSGNYSLIAIAANGCSDTANVSLTILTAPALGIDQSNTICGNTTLDLTSQYNTAGTTSNWTLNGNVVTNPSSVNSAGNYSLVVLSPNGCSDTANVSLTILTAPALGSDQSKNICSNSTLDLTSLYNTTGTTSSWTQNGNTVINPSLINSAGNYSLVAMAANGCSDTANVSLTILTAPALGIDQSNIICSNTTLDLTSLYNTAGTTSDWTLNGNVVTNPSSVNSAGNYSLVVLSPNGCSDTAIVSLSVLTAPSLGSDQSKNICSNSTLDLTSLYNTTGTTSSWTQNGNAVINPSLINLAGNYSLVAIAVSGCSDTANVSLTILTAPALGIDQSNIICSNTTLDLTSLYNTAGTTSDWTLNGNVVTNPSSVNSAGNYSLVVLSPNGCSDTANVSLSVLTAPSLGSDQSKNICSNSTLDLTSLYNTTGTTSSWTQNGNAVMNPSLINSAGNYSLVAIAANGCSDTANVSLIILTAPALGIDQLNSICSNTTLDLTSLYNTAGLTTNWTLNGNVVTNPSLVNSAGNYSLVVLSPNGCSDTAIVSLTILTAPSIGSDQSKNICSNSTLDLTSLYNTTGTTSNWTLNGNFVTNPSAVNTSGKYQIIAIGSFGCNDTAIVNVNVTTAPNLGSDLSYTLCPWMTIDLSSLYNLTGLNASYTLNGAPLSTVTSVNNSGTYAVNVVDSNGCSDQALVLISNIQCICSADFTYTANCLQDPVTFNIIADSSVIDVHWIFGNSYLHDQYINNPTVQFLTGDSVLVTLVAGLSCGTETIKKYIKVKDCSDSCHIYFPSGFTPNDDGLNDHYSWYGDCKPEEYRMEIRNSFGQLMFHTNNSDDSWDGLFEGNLAPAGIYISNVEYKLPYRNKEASINKITLIR